MDADYIAVHRKSPRFQLIKKAIDTLAPMGTYHFTADAQGLRPIEYKATRQQLEEVFAKAMSTPSYRDKGLYHEPIWPLADQFRVSEITD